MKIEKYIKQSSNKYKIVIDGSNYTLFDDIIIKYNLLLSNTITQDKLDKIIEENNNLESYYKAIKYISTKIRCASEIKNYLLRNNYSKDNIDKTIKKLYENNFLNDELYIKSYINDQLNLTNNGQYKIKKSLIKLGFDENLIDKYLDKIDETIYEEKITKYVEKKIKTNHNHSSYMLYNKLVMELSNLGYDKSIVINILNKYNIDDKDILKHEEEKIRKKLESKYQGYELEQKIKERLYRKGFYR